MPLSLTKQELVRQLSAKSTGACFEQVFSGCSFDSRSISKGELFICLKGVRHGHEFLSRAFEDGASLAVVEDNSLLKTHPKKDFLVSVEDSLVAFQTLTSNYRSTLKMPIVAVSGSMGKTTIKELASQLLGAVAAGTSSQKSFNNHIGVPYTICSIDKDDAWAVLEMGMNHRGELSELSKIAKPDIALLSCIAPVHLENFANLQEVTKAKFEILDGLTKNSVFILNSDDQELVRESKKQSAVFFGKDKGADFRIKDVVDHGLDGFSFSLVFSAEELHFKTSLLGVHNVYNLTAAISIALSVYPDFDRKKLVDVVRNIRPPKMRLNIVKLKDNKILIDDSYNSNPEALAASIRLLKPYVAEGKKVLAVLGDMHELGGQAKDYHIKISEVISEVGLSLLVTVGELSRYFAPKNLSHEHYKSAEEIDVSKFDFDVVLVKGSRGVGLDVVAGEITRQLGGL